MIYYILKHYTLHRRAPVPSWSRQNEGIMFLMNDEKTPVAKTGASAQTAAVPAEDKLDRLSRFGNVTMT